MIDEFFEMIFGYSTKPKKKPKQRKRKKVYLDSARREYHKRKNKETVDAYGQATTDAIFRK